MTNLYNFTNAVRTTTKCSVRCIHCGDLRSEIDVPVADFVAKAGLMGWKWVKSKSMDRAGPMCPECSAMPDNQRTNE